MTPRKGQRTDPASTTRHTNVLFLCLACNIGPSCSFVTPPLVSVVASSQSSSADVVAPSKAPCVPRRLKREHLLRELHGGAGAAEGGDTDIGLDGQWEADSWDGPSAGHAGTVDGDTLPGQLPLRTVDGQDWGEWAKEWRDNPHGKAERLVKQWEAEKADKDAGRASQNGDTGFSKKSKRRRKDVKNSLGPSRGFGGGANRVTKSVPVGLVVTEAETGTEKGLGGDEGVVDWSDGQTLAEAERERDFAAEWQGEADRLSKLTPSDRRKLEATLRRSLGKKPKKKGEKIKRTNAIGISTNGSNGFAAGVGGATSGSGATGGRQAKQQTDNRKAAVAFASVTTEGAGSSGIRDNFDGVLSAGVPAASDKQARTTPLPGGDGDDARENHVVTISGGVNVASPGEENMSGNDETLKRAMSFGKGIAVAPIIYSCAEAAMDVLEEGTLSDGDARVRNFGRGVSIPVDSAFEGGAKEGNEEEGMDESRIREFGKGIALPPQVDLEG